MRLLSTRVAARAAILFLFIISAPAALAYENYDDGCDTCHGSFDSGNYTSNKDGTSWGTDLMDGHDGVSLVLWGREHAWAQAAARRDAAISCVSPWT